MMKKFLFLVTIVAFTTIILASAQTTYSQTDSVASNPAEVEAVTKWLKTNAMPLETIEAGHGFEDLKPLKKILKGTRIVGVGEAMHGAHEFLQFKHRMVEFLVKEMGFTVVALEASYPACLEINEYVLHGKGDRSKVLAGQGYFTWDTKEVAEMIDWIYEYNKTQIEGKKVKFVGFDMQIYGHAYQLVEPYIAKVAPEYFERAGPDFLPAQLPSNEVQKRTTEEKERLKGNINKLLGFLTQNRTKFTRLTSDEEFQTAVQCTRILAQYMDMFSRPPFDQQNPTNGAVANRDMHMAENIEFIVNTEPPSSKIVVLAHNSHISSDNEGNKIPAMGSYLRKVYGKTYYALGLTFREGAFRTRNMDKDDLEHKGVVELGMGPPEDGLVEWYFGLLRQKTYIVDFRYSVKSPQVIGWLNTPHPMRSVGSGFSSKWPLWQYVEPTVLQNRFDGIVFIDVTTAAHPNAE